MVDDTFLWKPKSMYPCTKQQDTGPYAESEKFISYPVTVHVCRLFNIITTPTRLKEFL